MNNNEVRNLEPKTLWNYFEDLNAIPRGSKKEEKAVEFVKAFGEQLGLPTYIDQVSNVIIKKPATPGMEDRQTVVLQSHLDMVHQKNNDTDFDFDTQGIESYIDGDWVKANGTTLGADNGIGVATIMTLLASDDIAHPAIEALFTIDEETGMTGAQGLEEGQLEGTILLNLDTEDDDELCIGCAGGVDTTARREYNLEDLPNNVVAYRIDVKGLKGGHSGMEINLGRGNANKIMNRLLFGGWENYGLRIAELEGGSLRNAIPRESYAIVVVDAIQKEAFEQEFAGNAEAVKAEYAAVETNMIIELAECEAPAQVMELGVQLGVLRAVYAMPNGVYRMSPEIPDLVETSSNLSKVIIREGKFEVQTLQRSSVDSSKMDMAYSIRSAFELAGCEVEHTGSYPGWAPNANSAVLGEMRKLYEEMYNEKPNVMACHAGLECGIIGSHYPGLDMISFGPTIRNPHSPDEMVNIPSVSKFWDFLLATLKETPAK